MDGPGGRECLIAHGETLVRGRQQGRRVLSSNLGRRDVMRTFLIPGLALVAAALSAGLSPVPRQKATAGWEQEATLTDTMRVEGAIETAAISLIIF